MGTRGEERQNATTYIQEGGVKDGGWDSMRG